MLPVYGSNVLVKYFGEKILEVHISSTTYIIAVVRGLILLWILPVVEVFGGSMFETLEYCLYLKCFSILYYCSYVLLSTRSISVAVFRQLVLLLILQYQYSQYFRISYCQVQ